ncbi:hypothetical protein [Pseudomonas matsuisoli]|uniref:Uncharacterized protein n=1 Tax=Pseudomonas matsuisoli TaxID=1515666 RepID=A0A917PNG7_9PSED|nr:hypothetical protein [Pseudomonas matsuisoli]GGJ85806.1 hypothetical protein GCM10009304_09850 [Pseudomonas matsuisoli]
MSSHSDLAASRAAGPDVILSSLDPQRIAACFVPAILSEESVQLMLQEPRFHPRLMRVLERHYALASPGEVLHAEPVAAQIFIASPQRLEQFVRACGAVANAPAFTQAVQASQVKTLRERFGAAVADCALRHRTLAFDKPAFTDIDALDAAVIQDGTACLDAWRQGLSPALTGWMRLRTRAREYVHLTDEARAKGTQIVHALASEMLTTEVHP